MTPAVCISRHSSCPSQMRSPTPGKTATPLWRLVIACMNSRLFDFDPLAVDN